MRKNKKQMSQEQPLFSTVLVVFGTAQTTDLEQFLNIRLYTVHSREEATMQQQCTGYEVI